MRKDIKAVTYRLDLNPLPLGIENLRSSIEDFDLSIKVIAVGDAAVGKTSIAGRYVTGSFESSYKATIGTDIFSKIVKIDGIKIAILAVFSFWITAVKQALYYNRYKTCYCRREQK